MRTYRAELAPWRMRPLHDAFKLKALAHAKLLQSPYGSRRQAHETTCPYCGQEGNLTGTIRLGAKEQIAGIPMTREGYDIPGAEGREKEILVIHCGNPACEAAIDPLAYLSPATFYADKENVDIFDGK
jgi:hypothetical protein